MARRKMKHRPIRDGQARTGIGKSLCAGKDKIIRYHRHESALLLPYSAEAWERHVEKYPECGNEG